MTHEGLRRPELLPSAVASVLRERIVSGALPPGSRLVEATIAEQLDVSRGPVRDAIRQLIEEDLVQNHPHRGAYVVELSVQDVREIYDFRAAIEVRAARLVAVRARDGQVGPVLVEAFRGLESAAHDGDAARARELDLAFHEQMYQASGNGRLLAAFQRLVPVMSLVNRSRHELFHQLSDVPVEHRPIVDAIAAGDPDRAAAEVDRHLEHAKELLVDHLERIQASEAGVASSLEPAAQRSRTVRIR